MVRSCAVPGCAKTDLTTLCHRFPKRKEAFVQWQHALRLDHVDTNQLLHRSVVCTLHFTQTDYRNANSRMLNSVAVPKLCLFAKGPFYDSPTMAINTAPNSSIYKQTGQLPDTTKTTTPECDTLFIEPVEMLEIDEVQNDDEMVFYIEEEVPLAENTEVSSSVEHNQEEVLETCSSPEAKRRKSDSSEEFIETTVECEQENNELVEPLPMVECHHAATQTDDVEIVPSEEQLQRKMVDQFYPEYTGHSRLEMIKQLKEKDERLAELTKKLANFETAHAAMMKTMEAFKSIMN